MFQFMTATRILFGEGVLASSLSITNAKLGAAHGLASALGGKLRAPHSVITARLAPHVMRENIAAASEAGRQDVVMRYQKMAQLLCERSDAKPADGVLWVERTLAALDLPPLSTFGVCTTSFEQVAKDALKSVAIKGNPLPLNQERLVYILQQVCCCQAECDRLSLGPNSGEVRVVGSESPQTT